jgi:acetyl-CoA carboxylase carboxyltransferase component
VIANQPSHKAGAIDSPAALKAAHFIQLCDAFHLPLLFLCDCPGVLCGSGAEADGILRSAARMFAAQIGTTTIKLEVTLRKAFGFGGLLMGQSLNGVSRSFVLPGATLGGLPASGGAKVAGSDAATAAALVKDEYESSYRLAESGLFDDMIDPRQIRNALIRALNVALRGRQHPPYPVARVGIAP